MVLGAAAQEEGASTRATCHSQPQPDFGSVRAAPHRDPPVPRCCSSLAVPGGVWAPRGGSGAGTELGSSPAARQERGHLADSSAPRTDFVPSGAATGAGISATAGQTASPAVLLWGSLGAGSFPVGPSSRGRRQRPRPCHGLYGCAPPSRCPHPARRSEAFSQEKWSLYVPDTAPAPDGARRVPSGLGICRQKGDCVAASRVSGSTCPAPGLSTMARFSA